MSLQFIISGKILLQQLQNFEYLIYNNNSSASLDYFLFVLKNNKIEIFSSNLDCMMITHIDIVYVGPSSKFTLPSKILLETLKTLPDIPLTFLINETTYEIEISSNNLNYKLTGVNPEDYPNSPDLLEAKSIELNATILKKAIDNTYFATGDDEDQPAISGVLFKFENDSITFVATDAHKLVLYTRKHTSLPTATSFIVPQKTLNVLKQLLSSFDGNITLKYTNKNIIFNFDNYSFISNLIESRYPNYNAVIPYNNPNLLIIKRIELLESISRVSLFSNDTDHLICFKIEEKEIQISADNVHWSEDCAYTSAIERLNCEYNGEKIEIGFNALFLIEILTNMNCVDVIIKLMAHNRAALLMPTHFNYEGENLMIVLMPQIIPIRQDS